MTVRLPLSVSRATMAAALFCAAGTMSVPAVAQDAACAPVNAVETAPPPLPTYDQPPLPGPGYLWSPGNWSWDEDQGDYYWVPGTWVQPPRAGLLWTPGYWGGFAGGYIFHPGYWGDRVGFYGGINYGFGYGGAGYEGGRWDHGAFFYNRTVNNLQGARITNVYEKNVTIDRTINNVSYNGGKGGIEVRPTAEDRTIAKEQHFAPTPLQRKQVETASQDPSLFKRTNNGVPAIGATARPGELKGPGVVRARPAGEVVPANGARPAAGEPGRPGPAPAESSHALPVPGKELPAPAQQNRPAVEEKRAAPAPVTRVEPRPAAEPARPAVQENRPAVEERKPEQVRKEEPVARPEPAARPEARPEPVARPEPAARPEARPEQIARPEARPAAPAPRAAPPRPPAGHPAEEKRPEQR
ncbi:hypothetical protein [Bradyrhizobium genosp. P]|uniref:YXWGXW repeat-containing protein n=1 Tax=Bradyrhizobium genosp. P TaxID=83641 RepID=UPI003CF622F6